MKFYWGSGSPFAWRAMLALIVKGVEFEDVLLSFSEREHKAPEYLALNPRGRVPTLVDGDTVIYESLAIMTYADRKVAETPLFGRTAEEAAVVARIVSEHDSYIYPAAIGLIRPAFRGKVEAKTEEMQAGIDTLNAEFASLRTQLGEGPWLAGSAVSAADLTVYPSLMLIDRIMKRPDIAALELGIAPFAEPAVQAWKARVEALPGVDRAYPPHWKE